MLNIIISHEAQQNHHHPKCPGQTLAPLLRTMDMTNNISGSTQIGRQAVPVERGFSRDRRRQSPMDRNQSPHLGPQRCPPNH